MKSDPLVYILMSTYNGEKYIAEQLKSLFQQEQVKCNVIIRDDGSTDNTINILNEFCSEYSNIQIIRGENIGSCQSFFELLKFAYKNCNNEAFFAFCDQDDVWKKNKLKVALQTINKCDYTEPILYCSNLDVVDKDLNLIRKMYRTPVFHSRNTALLSNVATGCTMVFNFQLLRAFCSFEIPRNAVMHDWWIFVLASFFGNVIFDNNSYIYYRQHGANVYGARSKSIMIRSRNLLKAIINDKGQHYRQKTAYDFYMITQKYLSKEDLCIVRKIANYNKSIYHRFLLAMDFKNFKHLSFLIRLRIILGLI